MLVGLLEEISEDRVLTLRRSSMYLLCLRCENLDIYHIAYLMLFQMPYPARS
jgi:hypothetical protein